MRSKVLSDTTNEKNNLPCFILQGLSSQVQNTESTNGKLALTAQQPNAAASTGNLTTTVAPKATTSSKGNKEGDSMKAGDFEKHPKLAKEDKSDTGKLKYTNGGKILKRKL